MDLRVPARPHYEIDAPGTLVSRHQVEDAVHLTYDDSTVVTLQLGGDGLVTIAVSGGRTLGLDGTTGAIVVSKRATRARRRRETADAAAI